MNVLVVDRDRRRSRDVSNALARRGYDAHVARSARAALTFFSSTGGPSILYVTEHLAAVSGPDLLAAIERAHPCSKAPIVMGVDDETSVLAIALRHGGLETIVCSRHADDIATAIFWATIRNRRLDQHRAAVRARASELRLLTRQNLVRAFEIVARTSALAKRLRAGGGVRPAGSTRARS